MKTSVIAASAVMALLLLGVSTIALAHYGVFGPSNGAEAQVNANENAQVGQGLMTMHQDHESNDGAMHEHEMSFPPALNLTVGQSYTLGNLTGRYIDASNDSISGNATGSLTFTVTGAYRSGYTLSISSGTITIGNTTYTVDGGSLVVGIPFGITTGSGTAGTGNSFLLSLNGFHITNSTASGAVRLDFKSGSSEYLVFLGMNGFHQDD
jgi:hypothetical protein